MKNKWKFRSFWNIAWILAMVTASGCAKNTTTPTQLPVTQSLAEETIPAGEVSILLFQDDFQDGDLQGWTTKNSWTVRQHEDKYYFSAAGFGGAYIREGGAWNNYTYRSTFRVDQGALLISIYVSQSGRYGLLLGGKGVYLFKEQPPGTTTMLGEVGPVALGIWNRVSFACQDGHLQVQINDKLWFDIHDDMQLTKGTIAVGATENSNVSVDNILVTKIEGELVAGSVEAPLPTGGNSGDRDIEGITGSLPSDEIEIQEVIPAVVQPPSSGGMPDLVVTTVFSIPDPVTQGDQFSMSYTVGNNGNAAAGSFTFLLHFHALAAIEDCAMSVESLAPGQVASASCARTITGNTGNYPIEATADIYGTVAESNEGNNMIVSSIAVIDPAPPQPPPVVEMPDLTPLAISYEMEENGIPYYRCSFINSGNANTNGMVNISISKDGDPFYDSNAQSLDGGQSFFMVFPATGALPFSLTCTVDATGTIVESNENNNSITVAFP